MSVPVHQPAAPRRALVRSEGEQGIFRRSAYPLTLILSATVVVVLITVVGFVLRSHPVDLPLAIALNGLHVGAIGAFTTAVYQVINPVPAIILTLLICAGMWLVGKNLRGALAFGGMIAVTWVPSAVVKLLVDRPRPAANLLPHAYTPAQIDASFPSGHTVFIVAFIIAMAYLLRDTRWHRLWLVVGTGLVVIVALSVTIDAVHYPTDALASVGWSLAVAPAVRVIGVDWLIPRIPFLNRTVPAGELTQ